MPNPDPQILVNPVELYRSKTCKVLESRGWRYLFVDGVCQTAMNLSDPHGRGLPHLDFVDEVLKVQPIQIAIARVLCLGLGGGTVPKRLIRDYPEIKHLEMVDNNKEVIRLAKQFFDCPNGVWYQDALDFLDSTNRVWDLIHQDLFVGLVVPFKFTTSEWFELVAEHLANESGLLVVHTLGDKTAKRVSRNLTAVFGNIIKEQRFDNPIPPHCYEFLVGI